MNMQICLEGMRSYATTDPRKKAPNSFTWSFGAEDLQPDGMLRVGTPKERRVR